MKSPIQTTVVKFYQITLLHFVFKIVYESCTLFGWLISHQQQYFPLRTNQPPATSQQYYSLRTNQHQSSATSQPNRLVIATPI
jgi:hypothetical protein